MELFQQSFALVLVFGLLGGALWFLKNRHRPGMKMLGMAARGERRMQVVERLSLTPNHTLCLVKIGQRLVMIGTGPTSCQVMESLEETRG